MNFVNKNKKVITIGTLFSGMGSAIFALNQLNVTTRKQGHKFIIIPAFCAENNETVNAFRGAVLRYNNPYWKIPNLGDVTKITKKDLKVYINAIDIVVFGSPTRNALLWEAVRIINIIKPKYVIFENVKGILSFPRIIKQYYDELDAYSHAQPTLLDPVKYNIPMKRPRVFIVSILKSLKKQELVKTLPNKLLMKRKPLTKKLYEMMVHHRIDLYDDHYPLPKRIYHNNGVFGYLKNTKNSFDRVWNTEHVSGTFSASGQIKVHDGSYWMELTNHDKLRLMGFCYQNLEGSRIDYSWNDYVWRYLCEQQYRQKIKNYQLSKAIGNAMSVDMLVMLFKTILIEEQ